VLTYVFNKLKTVKRKHSALPEPYKTLNFSQIYYNCRSMHKASDGTQIKMSVNYQDSYTAYTITRFYTLITIPRPQTSKRGYYHTLFAKLGAKKGTVVMSGDKPLI